MVELTLESCVSGVTAVIIQIALDDDSRVQVTANKSYNELNGEYVPVLSAIVNG